MSEEQKKTAEEIARTLEALEPQQKEAALAFVSGMAAAAQIMKAEQEKAS